MTKIIRTTEESGRSMVEMLGVLAIVGVLSIGGIAGYSKAMAKYKVNKTLDQLSMLITNVRTTFGNQSSYYGLNEKAAIDYDIVGNDLSLGSTSTLTNAYNGEVNVKAGTSAGVVCSGTTYCPTFIITFKKLEKNACAAIASSDWGSSAASGLISISINGDKFEWKSGENKTNTLPISFIDAAGACDDDGDDPNTIEWVYN